MLPAAKTRPMSHHTCPRHINTANDTSVKPSVQNTLSALARTPIIAQHTGEHRQHHKARAGLHKAAIHAHQPQADARFRVSATVIGKVPLGAPGAERSKKANAATDNMVISSIGFNTATGANEATSAPQTGRRSRSATNRRQSFVGDLPAWRKPCKPDTDCSDTPHAVAAVCDIGRTPNIINTGKIRLSRPRPSYDHPRCHAERGQQEGIGKH